MASVDVFGSEKKKAGSIELDPRVFEAPTRPDLFHAEVRRQLALRHRGTHSSKNRSEVSGGGAKPYRQKGTGRARQGTTRAPQFAGGGSVFGPVPRGYAIKSPKKVRKAALRSALSHRLAEGSLTIVDGVDAESGRTKAMATWLSGLGLSGKSVLIVIAGSDEKLVRATGNLGRVDVLHVEGLNVYDVLQHAQLVMTQDAVESVQARLGVSEEAKS